MVVGTGDLSELALGWATYNGDHMSMYGVNGSIPKTLVKHLVKWVAENDIDETSRATLLDIVDTLSVRNSYRRMKTEISGRLRKTL